MRSVLLVVFVFWVTLIEANPNEQTRFQRSVTDNSIDFLYEWQNHSNEPESISFSLDPNIINKLPHQLANYRPRMAMRYVTTELLRHAKTVDPRQARISIRQMGEEVEVGVRSNDTALMQQLRTDFLDRKDKAFSQYLFDHYYMMFTPPNGSEAIKPDHGRYVEAYTGALIPASQAFYEKLGQGTDARDYINMLLSWIQSIPYSELNDRSESNGSGFAPPAALLKSNLGDCDSKSVLAAAMIRAFLPKVPIRLVLLPEHALLGVAISQGANDEVLNENGLQLVLMEPTGPAPLKFGQIAESSRVDIASNLYVLEVVP